MRCRIVAASIVLAAGLVASTACTTDSAIAARPPAAIRPRPAATQVTLPPAAPPVVIGASGGRSTPVAGPTPNTSTFETAVSTARRENKLAVVDFGAQWCGPCKTMLRTTWSDPALVSWLARNATRAHVDIEQRSDLSQRYDIGAVPTTIVLRDGQEVGRFTGARGAADVQAWLQGFVRAAPSSAAPPVRAAATPRPAPASSMTRVTVTR